MLAVKVGCKYHCSSPRGPVVMLCYMYTLNLDLRHTWQTLSVQLLFLCVEWMFWLIKERHICTICCNVSWRDCINTKI